MGQIMTDKTEVQNIPAVFNFAFVPVCTRERFAQFSGLGEEVVRGMCDRGYLPTVKLGKYSLINLAALFRQCSQSELEQLEP
jgi:hypothetical protein